MDLSGEALEHELSSLLLHKSLSETDDIDPITVVSIHRGQSALEQSSSALL